MMLHNLLYQTLKCEEKSQQAESSIKSSYEKPFHDKHGLEGNLSQDKFFKSDIHACIT